MVVSSPDFYFMAIHTNAGFRNDYPLLDAQNDWQASVYLDFYWGELPYERFLSGQISKNLKCGKTHLKCLYWSLLAALSDISHSQWTSQIIVWVPGGGRSHEITMAHLPDASVSSGQSVNHPEMPESTCLLLSTLESTGGGWKALLLVKEKNTLLNIHLPRPVLRADTPSSWLISYLEIQRSWEEGQTARDFLLLFWDTF